MEEICIFENNLRDLKNRRNRIVDRLGLLVYVRDETLKISFRFFTYNSQRLCNGRLGDMILALCLSDMSIGVLGRFRIVMLLLKGFE